LTAGGLHHNFQVDTAGWEGLLPSARSVACLKLSGDDRPALLAVSDDLFLTNADPDLSQSAASLRPLPVSPNKQTVVTAA